MASFLSFCVGGGGGGRGGSWALLNRTRVGTSLESLTRSCSRELRIRVLLFESSKFSRGTLPGKKLAVGKRAPSWGT